MAYNREIILNSFEKLISNVSKSSLDEIEDIRADASDKKIYRLFVNGTSFIGVFNENQKENLAFINFTKTFLSLNLNVPEIIRVSEDNLFYIEEDLGDVTLFKMIQEEDERTLMGHYKQVLSDLIKFQILSKDIIDYKYCYQTSDFTKDVIRDDIDKFNNFFAKNYLTEKLDRNVLQIVINISGDVLSNVDSNFFLYRDFQPRNILLRDNKHYYIDYQAGRRGPLQYDLASFLYSGSIQLEEDQRSNLLDHYKSELKKYITVNEEEFKYYFYFLSFLRLIQVLGSYAFQHETKNDEKILKKIPKAISNMKGLRSKIENKEIKELISTITKHYKT